MIKVRYSNAYNPYLQDADNYTTDTAEWVATIEKDEPNVYSILEVWAERELGTDEPAWFTLRTYEGEWLDKNYENFDEAVRAAIIEVWKIR